MREDIEKQKARTVRVRTTHIEARDLSEAFFKSCRGILSEGYEYVIDKGSFEGTKRKELDFVSIHILHCSRN